MPDLKHTKSFTSHQECGASTSVYFKGDAACVHEHRCTLAALKDGHHVRGESHAVRPPPYCATKSLPHTPLVAQQRGGIRVRVRVRVRVATCLTTRRKLVPSAHRSSMIIRNTESLHAAKYQKIDFFERLFRDFASAWPQTHYGRGRARPSVAATSSTQRRRIPPLCTKGACSVHAAPCHLAPLEHTKATYPPIAH